MSNPFFYGPYITDRRYFVGRRAELTRIFSALETADSGQAQPVALVGPHRIGKSSLLVHVVQTYPEHLQKPGDYHFIYVDLTNPRCQAQAGLLGYILAQLNLPSDAPDLPAFAAALERQRAAGGPLAVVALDEFEHLTQRRECFPYEFFTGLRSLVQAGQVVLLPASRQPLDELFAQGGLTSPFHNIFHNLVLGDLAPNEADELLARGRSGERPFNGSECADLRRLAGEAPYALQLAASLLYQAKAAPPVDWARLQADFQAQLGYATRTPPPRARRIAAGARALNTLRRPPRAVGRLLLDLLKNDKASEATAEILGWLVLALAFWLIAGSIDWGQLSALLAGLRGLFK